MADRPDKDQLVRRPAAGPGVTASGQVAALPVSEPGARSLTEQRADLQRMIYELEGTLKYMGAAHAQRATTEARLKQLASMLQQIEAALGLEP